MLSLAKLSLKQRALYTLMPVFLLFFIVFAYLLHGSYARSLKVSTEQQLMLQIRLLLADSELDGSGTLQVLQVREPKLTVPDTELQAVIVDAQQRVIWQSPSVMQTDNVLLEKTLSMPAVQHLRLGDQRFLQASDGFFVAAFTIAFEKDDENASAANRASSALTDSFTYLLMDDGSDYHAQLAVFQRTLFIGLLLAFVVFSAIQLLVFRWLFTPLKTLGRELYDVERGSKQAFEERYPGEIAPLTDQLNHFIDSEIKQRERYRNTLADLAHSLKTPLAALRATLDVDNARSVDRKTVSDQVERMEQIVSHQLKRASHQVSHQLGRRVDATGIIQRLLGALGKVYQHKSVDVALQMPEPYHVLVAEDDFYELMGNLLDNAFKYCDKHITISAENASADTLAKICIDNDGQRMSLQDVALILQRGVRLDETVEGQGIGLTVAQAIVKSYEGAITLANSRLGGTAVMVELPLKIPKKQ